MIIIMIVSLYTSRIVLKALGVEDFGIYNVVGGIVLMFSFLNSSMTSATQRFFSYELGKNNQEQLRKVFIMSVNIHAIISIIIVLFAETVGLWFLNEKLNISPERLEAANWVFQFSLFSFIVSINAVPYNAAIVAHERMNIYAYVSIFEALAKLGIVFLLLGIHYDKLKLYSFLIFCIALLTFVIYRIYCKRKLPSTNYYPIWNRDLFTTLTSYAGWNIFGNLAHVTMAQGINILLNIFFGPVVNASRAIAFQVYSAVSGFVSNFQMALNPQIIKSYASDDKVLMHQLIFRGARFSFFMLYFLVLPILLEAESVLLWWLGIVPAYSVLFLRLVLLNLLVDSFSGPLMTGAQASGRIKMYQLVVGGLLILNLPVSYLFLKFGFDPQITMIISIFISVVALFSRLYIISPLINLSIFKFISNVLNKALLIGITAIIIPFVIRMIMDPGFLRFLIVCISSAISTCFFVYYLGLQMEERSFVNSKLEVISTYFKKR